MAGWNDLPLELHEQILFACIDHDNFSYRPNSIGAPSSGAVEPANRIEFSALSDLLNVALVSRSWMRFMAGLLDRLYGWSKASSISWKTTWILMLMIRCLRRWIAVIDGETVLDGRCWRLTLKPSIVRMFRHGLRSHREEQARIREQARQREERGGVKLTQSAQNDTG